MTKCAICFFPLDPAGRANPINALQCCTLYSRWLHACARSGALSVRAML